MKEARSKQTRELMVKGEIRVNEAGRVRQGVSETGSDGEGKKAGMS